MSLGGDDGYGDGYGGQDPARTGGTGRGGGDAHLTRTHLPEGDGDGYGSPRRPTRTKPSRNLITVVSVVVILIAAIAFANRGGNDDSDDTSTSSSSGSNGDGNGNGPKAEATAPTGERPVNGKNEVTGIASGFPRTEQGAQSAAANYAVALGSDGMFKADRRHAIVNAIYAPESAPGRQAELDNAFTSEKVLANAGLDAKGNAPDGMTFVSRANPVGTKVEKYENGTAQVAVWSSVLFGLAGEGSKNPVTEAWYTDTFDLKWVRGDWKVVKHAQKNGPAPVGRDQAASSAKEISDAVQGFGGFTYAR
ncbi:hypothetical protein [Streptomyces sp. XD-27]|uniref:hypothetical protein n=1 Tax=Streptomyces sp. XD-27 TaxID=3062779 RepID=UPI0026F42D6A|nr:hypothetical protein [Streptomyces sp. XD-27]WKX71182.1 hypothetical protein Q3Y56_15790 [Streptomyces sp. XD-27]